MEKNELSPVGERKVEDTDDFQMESGLGTRTPGKAGEPGKLQQLCLVSSHLTEAGEGHC